MVDDLILAISFGFKLNSNLKQVRWSVWKEIICIFMSFYDPD